MTTYTIVTGEGGELSSGIQGHDQAMRAAQEFADQLCATVYVSGPGIEVGPDDDEDIGLAVEPFDPGLPVSHTYRMEVCTAEWAGVLANGWRPAIAGTLNQTDLPDEQASAGLTAADALSLWEQVVQQNPQRARLTCEGTGEVVRTHGTQR